MDASITMREHIFAFDFDGTLTYKDSFLALCIFKAGKIKFFRAIIRFFPHIIAMIFSLCSASKTKEKIFAYFFAGMSLSDFNNLCADFAKSRVDFIRQEGLNAVNFACKSGKCLIVSASAKNWIAPFFDFLIPDNSILYLTTELETDENNILTGRFSGKNCKGSEKVRRIKAIFPNRSEYTLIAYGDSRGDKEMLAEADESFYKPFQSRKIAGVLSQAVRFCITGTAAVIIQYVCYRFLLKIFLAIVANSISYAISMSVNFLLSSVFTFRVKPSKTRLIGFLFSHAINYSLQTLLLFLFVKFGISKQIAPIPVYALCVPINFFMVRFFLRRL